MRTYKITGHVKLYTNIFTFTHDTDELLVNKTIYTFMLVIDHTQLKLLLLRCVELLKSVAQ